jgi:hypothetical protein
MAAILEPLRQNGALVLRHRWQHRPTGCRKMMLAKRTFRALTRGRERLCAAVDADDKSGGANQLADKHQDIAGAAADVEHAQARRDSRAAQPTFEIGRRIAA